MGQALSEPQTPGKVLASFQHDGGPSKMSIRHVEFGSAHGFNVVYFCEGACSVLSGDTAFTVTVNVSGPTGV